MARIFGRHHEKSKQCEEQNRMDFDELESISMTYARWCDATMSRQGSSLQNWACARDDEVQ